jgi:UDP-N-acetylmuramyl pentapeptide phosphotransferase/UDP-N-acetylglucosamine-1-phosphate transferase
VRYHDDMYQEASAPIALLAVVGAGIVAAIIGYLWYHPRAFGGPRLHHLGISGHSAHDKRMMPRMAGISLLASILIAYVMLQFGAAWSVSAYPWWIGAPDLAFWCWIGFAAPILLNAVLWERKPFTLYLIDAGYWLVALLAMSLVLLL